MSQQLQFPGKEGQAEAGRSLGGTKALVCVYVCVSLCQKASFHPKRVLWEGGRRERAFLLPDDLGKLITHRGSRS